MHFTLVMAMVAIAQLSEKFTHVLLQLADSAEGRTQIEGAL
jgi:hypothetical protein